MKIIKDATWLLNSTIKYYSKDTRRRCASSTGECRYSPKTLNKEHGSGCAIGRHMTPKNRLEADSLGVMSINVLLKKRPDLLPEWMQKIDVSILSLIQELHDIACCWSTNGLSSYGERYVEIIVEQIENSKN